MRKLSPKYCLLLTTVTLLFLHIINSNSYAFFGGQDFAIPIESQTRHGYMINKYFHLVANEVLGGLFKFGIALAVFLTIIRFGFGDTKYPKEFFISYVLVLILLIAPLIKGKSLPIFFMDSLDMLTAGIVDKIGVIRPEHGGSVTITKNAFTFARQEASKATSKNLAYAYDCYEKQKNIYIQKNPNATIPGMFEIKYSGTTTPDGANCADYVPMAAQSFKITYNQALASYIKEAVFKTGHVLSKPNKEAIETEEKKDINDESIKKMISEESQKAYQAWQSSQSGNPPQDETKMGFWEGLYSALTDGRLISRIVTVLPRMIILIVGYLSLYLFDTYLYTIVSFIKTVAAIGFVFGVLYFAFFHKLDTVIGAIGVWMFGNAYYIVASIAMMEFYANLERSLTTVVHTLIGVPNAYMEGIFMLGFIGFVGAALAGILTWKGITFAITQVSGSRITTKGI